MIERRWSLARFPIESGRYDHGWLVLPLVTVVLPRLVFVTGTGIPTISSRPEVACRIDSSRPLRICSATGSRLDFAFMFGYAPPIGLEFSLRIRTSRSYELTHSVNSPVSMNVVLFLSYSAG